MTKKITIIILSILALITIIGIAYLSIIMKTNKKISLSLDDKLSSVKSDYALVIPNQAIDGYPVWSEDGKFVYAQVGGLWMKLNIDKIHLSSGNWEGMQIGVNDNQSSLESAEESQKTIDSLVLKNNHDDKDIVFSDGNKFEFKQSELHSEFVMTKPSEKPKTLWQTDLGLCYYLVLSPNQKYILFKCELNGIMLMKLK